MRKYQSWFVWLRSLSSAEPVSFLSASDGGWLAMQMLLLIIFWTAAPMHMLADLFSINLHQPSRGVLLCLENSNEAQKQFFANRT